MLQKQSLCCPFARIFFEERQNGNPLEKSLFKQRKVIWSSLNEEDELFVLLQNKETNMRQFQERIQFSIQFMTSLL